MVLGLRRRRAEKEVSIAGRMNSAVSCTETSMRNSDVIQKAQRGFRAFAEPVLRRATGPSDVPLPGAISGTQLGRRIAGPGSYSPPPAPLPRGQIGAAEVYCGL